MLLILSLHQTTTARHFSILRCSCYLSYHYIKPQPSPPPQLAAKGCYLSYYYIKPQHDGNVLPPDKAVTYPITTSNHNRGKVLSRRSFAVTYPITTSNHNYEAEKLYKVAVVTYFVSTSNHNTNGVLSKKEGVVTYFVSTSNHNFYFCSSLDTALLLILFLHQTTTLWNDFFDLLGCYLFCFYIKPQLVDVAFKRVRSCYLFCFYIKPQRRSASAIYRSVVTYFVSTSNHNEEAQVQYIVQLLLILFLHQTTTKHM